MKLLNLQSVRQFKYGFVNKEIKVVQTDAVLQWYTIRNTDRNNIHNNYSLGHKKKKKKKWYGVRSPYFV